MISCEPQRHGVDRKRRAGQRRGIETIRAAEAWQSCELICKTMAKQGIEMQWHRIAGLRPQSNSIDELGIALPGHCTAVQRKGLQRHGDDSFAEA